MRTIKFRGKSKFNSEWVYGDLVQCMSDDIKIVNSNRPKDLSYRINDIQSDTVGQFTGLCDKNGKEIYEGDIVRSVRYKEFVYKVVYDNKSASFCLDRKQDMYKHYFGEAMEAEDCEVIGNILDNPELLKNNDLKE